MANPLIPDVKYATLITMGDGAKTEWEFNFAGGYISKDHVKAFTEDTSTGQLVIRPVEFVGPNTIRIAPAVANGLRLVIYRDTPKTDPIVDYTEGSIINESNLDKSNRQAVFIAAELADRVIADYDFSNALLYATVTATAAKVVAEGIDAKASAALATVAFLPTDGGASGVGFRQAGAETISTTVDAELKSFRSVAQYGALSDGMDITALLRKATANIGVGHHIRLPSGNYRLSGKVTIRASALIFDGEGSTITLTTSDAGIELAGSYNLLRSLTANQSTQVTTPTFIRVFNDATSKLSIHNTIKDCNAFDVYRAVDCYMNLNGSGEACYRTRITSCTFINKYRQKTWAGSFGVSFDGPHSGDAAGNDSRCEFVTVAGYENNYIINNSVVVQYVHCSGDGGGNLFNIAGNSSGIQITGGYYEYNTVLFATSGSVKYDLYLNSPSFSNWTTTSTGPGFTLVLGTLPAGAPIFTLTNGNFVSKLPTGEAEVSAINGIKFKTGISSTVRATLDNAGDWTFKSGRVLLEPGVTFGADVVQGYSGGSVPLTLSAANTVVIATANAERLRVTNAGDVLIPAVYTTTTQASANVVVGIDGTLMRASSAAKYKKNVQDVTEEQAAAVFQMRPVTYNSVSDTDDSAVSYLGFIADDMVDVCPSLVNFGPSRWERITDGGITREVPAKGAALIPEGVQYERITALLVKIVHMQDKAIKELQAAIKKG